MLKFLSLFVKNILLFVMIFTLPFFEKSNAQQYEFTIPKIDDIKVEKLKSIRIPGPTTATVFRFNDGIIVLGTGKNVKWSYDNGQTWVDGVPGPNARNTVDLGNGEIISIGPHSILRPDGKFTLKMQRSTDNWKTVVNEESILDIPNSSFTITGDGSIKDGFIFHHGILKLEDGTLIGTMYGNYEGDNIFCDGYPPELNQRKYRTIVVFSNDEGRTWGNHVLVAYDKMLGRGIEDNHPLLSKCASTTAIVPAITQEGFREADIVQAKNGDLLCVMRSGGRNSEVVNLFPTPLYCSRSADNGRSWSHLPNKLLIEVSALT